MNTLDNMCRHPGRHRRAHLSVGSALTQVLSVETAKWKHRGREFIICWNSSSSAADVLTTGGSLEDAGASSRSQGPRGRKTALPVQNLQERVFTAPHQSDYRRTGEEQQTADPGQNWSIIATFLESQLSHLEFYRLPKVIANRGGECKRRVPDKRRRLWLYIWPFFSDYILSRI